MKICIIGTAYPYKGGIAAFNERMAHELIACGHEVDILTFTLQYPGFLYPGKSQYSDGAAPDLSIERGINTVNPLTWIKYGRKYRRRQYDLIISKFWLPVIGPALGTTIRQMVGSRSTKTISIIDNIIPHEKRPGDALFTTYFTRSVDGFVVMSHQVERDMTAFIDQQPVVYAPHPIYDSYGEILSRSEAMAHLGLDPQYEYVLFFGFIRKYKGLDLLLESFAVARRSRPSLRLIVAGEYYSDAAEYETLLDSLRIRDYVTMHTDFIPNEEVRYYFCAADLLAQTYRSATQSGISQLAIHFEKPILSTNVGGLPETTIHMETGYLVDVDVEQISQQMVDHFGGEQVRDFTAGIQKLKEQFSWSNFADQLVSLYKKIA